MHIWCSMMDKSFTVLENKKIVTESDFVYVLVLFFVFYPHPFSRQLQQQQQQAELEGGGTRDSMYEAGPITLSQVSPHCLPLVLIAIFLERLNGTQKQFSFPVFILQQSSLKM